MGEIDIDWWPTRFSALLVSFEMQSLQCLILNSVDDTFLGGAFFGIYTVRHQSVENKMNIRAKQKRFMITRQMYIRIMLKLQCIQQIHNMLTPSLIHIFKWVGSILQLL